jgi:hypothetical protein
MWNFKLHYQQLHWHTPNNWQLNIFFSRVCTSLLSSWELRTAPLNHSSELSWCHYVQPPVQLPCHCTAEHITAYSCFLSADIRYPTINIWQFKHLLSTGFTWSISVLDNHLPFNDYRPCASTTRFGNDAATFHRRVQICPCCCAMLQWDSTIREQVVRHPTACPNNFRKPFVIKKCCVWRIVIGICVCTTKSGWNGSSKLKYSRAPVPTDSVSAVYRGPKKNWKIKEINGS